MSLAASSLGVEHCSQSSSKFARNMNVRLPHPSLETTPLLGVGLSVGDGCLLLGVWLLNDPCKHDLPPSEICLDLVLRHLKATMTSTLRGKEKAVEGNDSNLLACGVVVVATY